MTATVLPWAAPPECGCQDCTPRTQFWVSLLSLNVLLVLSLKALPSPSAGQFCDASIQSVNPYWQSCLFQQAHLNYLGGMAIPYSSSMLYFKLLFISVLPVPLLGKDDDVHVTSGWFHHFLGSFLCPDIAFLPQLLFLCINWEWVKSFAIPTPIKYEFSHDSGLGVTYQKAFLESWNIVKKQQNCFLFFNSLQTAKAGYSAWYFRLCRSGSQAVWIIWHSLRPQLQLQFRTWKPLSTGLLYFWLHHLNYNDFLLCLSRVHKLCNLLFPASVCHSPLWEENKLNRELFPLKELYWSCRCWVDLVFSLEHLAADSLKGKYKSPIIFFPFKPKHYNPCQCHEVFLLKMRLSNMKQLFNVH